jgi:hypothetical protein
MTLAKSGLKYFPERDKCLIDNRNYAPEFIIITVLYVCPTYPCVVNPINIYNNTSFCLHTL